MNTPLAGSGSDACSCMNTYWSTGFSEKTPPDQPEKKAHEIYFPEG
ncbi:hypothetical protein [Candidatus Sororendozoicomonas aggregata]